MPSSRLRTQLAAGLSAMYAAEVPLYGALVDTCGRLNAGHFDQTPAVHGRVGQERHGAVRFGSTDEVAQFAKLFGLFGMYPVGLYDLRDTATSSLPIVATAFRPIDATELQTNPFRLFTSVLVPSDRRYFSEHLQVQIEEHVNARELMSPELADLVEHATDSGGVSRENAGRLIELTIDALRLDSGALDEAWNAELHAISPVAADIAGARSTHLNHLTPRVFDIDELYADMEAQGVAMIDKIQGPPQWNGPLLLLRQTSFRALDEARTMIGSDGIERQQHVRVRFGEVEQRGVAVTPKGRLVVDEAMASDDVVAALNDSLPSSLNQLAEAGYVYVQQTHDGLEGITYEDFLPASAAGIFESNLDHAGTKDATAPGAAAALARLNDALGHVHDPYALYEQQSLDV